MSDPGGGDAPVKISKSLRTSTLGLGLVVSAQTPLFADPLIDAGRKISQVQCSRCHVIGDFNPSGGISSTPSFQMMVNALPDWEERFSTLLRPPPPSRGGQGPRRPPDPVHGGHGSRGDRS